MIRTRVIFLLVGCIAFFSLHSCSEDVYGDGIELGLLTKNWDLQRSILVSTGRSNPFPAHTLLQFEAGGTYRSLLPNSDGTYHVLQTGRFLYDTESKEIKVLLKNAPTWVWNVKKIRKSELVLQTSLRNPGITPSEVVRNTYTPHEGKVTIGK